MIMPVLCTIMHTGINYCGPSLGLDGRGEGKGGEGQIENFALIAINNQIPTANRRNVPEIATGLGM